MIETSRLATLELRSILPATWRAFQRHAITFVVAAALTVVLVAVSFTLATGPLIVGFVRMAKLALADEPLEISDLWSGFHKIGRPVVAWLFILVGVGVTSILVLPGVILGHLWLYTFWYLSESPDTLASDALRASWRLSCAHLPSTILIGLMVIFLNTLGLFAFGIGFFLSLPLSFIFITACFEQLKT